MDSWTNFILQWVNCLYDNINNCIRSLEELEDGKIYYNLINKISSSNQKQYNYSHKQMVQQFMENEYPNIILNNCKSLVGNLYIATLILSRLSLEPIFHKSLCMNLPLDMQVKIKSILESIYILGKEITVEDLCKILSISDKTNVDTCSLKPKYLQEFLNSPVIRSVNNDNKIHEQSRQLRNLRANIETLQYEKSELVEDIKIQQNQIKELQNKLQKTLSESKLLHEVDKKINNFNCSYQIQDVKLMQSTYEKEIQSLEKYITVLQNDNLKLEDEKNLLTNELKMYKKKCYILEEKHINNQQTLESTLNQLDKKEEELSELTIKHEELYNYLKEKSNIYKYNESFDLNDKGIYETTLNKSETLSSVIEIQLQDTKKELIITENKFKIVNTLLTIIMEEYKKLKDKVEILLKNNVKMKIEIHELHEKQNKNKENVSKDQYNLIEREFAIAKLNDRFHQYKILFQNIFKNNLTNSHEISHYFSISICLDLLNINDLHKDVKSLKHNIFKIKKYIYIKNILLIYNNNLLKKEIMNEMNMKSTNVNISKIFQKNKYNLNSDLIDTFGLCKIYEIFNKEYQQNKTHIITMKFLKNILALNVIKEEKNTFYNVFFNIINYQSNTINTIAYFKLLNLIENNEILNLKECIFRRNIQTYSWFNIKHLLITPKIINIICIKPNIIKLIHKYTVKNNKIKCLQYNKTNNNYSKLLSLNKGSLKSLQSTWIFLLESVYSNFEICKVLLLLEKRWFFTFEVLKYFIDNFHINKQKLKELLKKKDLIDNELKNIHFDNLQFLSIKLISTVQFVAMLSKNYYYELYLQDDKLTNFNLKNRIIIISKQINNFNNLLKLYERNLTIYKESTISSQRKDKNIDTSMNLYENKSILIEYESNTFKSDNENYLHNLPKCAINYNEQFQNNVKKIHEKYEVKLEKMKEKMKSVYNNQINMIKKQQEVTTKKQIEALELKIKYQCYSHTEDLKKYKKHISELSKQLWHVGDKLINEKQEKENLLKKLQDLKINYKNNELQNKRFVNDDLNNYSIIKSKIDPNILQTVQSNSVHEIHNLRGFQIIGNAFNTEDEEGEVFDTTCLSDMQKSHNISSVHGLNRLSILQNRNAKCKPHLKSSYPAELQYHPVPFTEDEIKTGSTSEELFNDSLSQSLLTGKKVKWKDRTRNVTETPRRNRRFSNIFRKHRLSIERK
jgi:hypothetical protein